MLVVGLILGGFAGVLAMSLVAANALAGVRAERDAARRELSDARRDLEEAQAGLQSLIDSHRALARNFGRMLITNIQLQNQVALLKAGETRAPTELPS